MQGDGCNGRCWHIGWVHWQVLVQGMGALAGAGTGDGGFDRCNDRCNDAELYIFLAPFMLP